MTREQAWDAFNDIPEDVKNAIYLIVGYVTEFGYSNGNEVIV